MIVEETTVIGHKQPTPSCQYCKGTGINKYDCDCTCTMVWSQFEKVEREITLSIYPR